MKRGDVRLPFLSVLVVGLIGLVFVGTTTALRHRELIIGGHDAEPHRFPYYVSLDYHNGVVLSGALIAPDFVLTAGHCLENDNEKVTLRVGTYSLMNSSKENSNATMTATTDEDDEDSMILPEVVRIQQAIRHPSFLEFQTECFTHDFLLFQLQSPTHIPYAKINRDPNIPQPVTFETTTRTTTTVKHSSTAKHHHSSASTSVIVMESNDDDDDNNNNNVGYDEDPDPNAVIMMGLGWTSQYFSSPAFTLQMADLYPISNEECATQSHDPTGQLTYQGLLDSTMLCTKGGRNNTRDGCAWDSGDPVILPGSRPEEDMIVGLGSWGFGCADPNFPGVQARVSAAADWIDEMVCQYSVDPPADFKCSQKKKSSATTVPTTTTTIQPTATPTIRKTTAPSTAPIQPTEMPSLSNNATSSNVTLPTWNGDITEPSNNSENTNNDATHKGSSSPPPSFSWRLFVLLIACAAVLYVVALFIHRQRQQQQQRFNELNEKSEIEGLLFHKNNNNDSYESHIRSNERAASGYGSTATQ